jgi:hypothetical protein
MNKSNESRRHEIPKARYQVTNRRQYFAALVRSPSQNSGKVVAYWFPERRVSTTDELIEVTVENTCSGLKQ